MSMHSPVAVLAREDALLLEVVEVLHVPDRHATRGARRLHPSATEERIDIGYRG
jgi:hypothetical protein